MEKGYFILGRSITLMVFAFLCLFLVSASCSTPSELQASPAELQWFRDAKFGMFIHWGPVTLKGTEISWSRGGKRPGMEEIPEGPIPVAEYDSLYKRFNPTKFDAAEWVQIAKKAGCQYLVFTTKHHDGFSMFDSKLTDYKITNSPFKRDVTAELAQACHEANLKLGFYFTAPDWHNPDFLRPSHPKFVRYFAGQIRELCSNYGKVSIFWFDMGGPPNLYDGEAVIPMIRRMQPGILINNRLGLPCDYDTPEQRVGGFQNQRPWESCITIGDQWSWRPNENVKSLKQCIQTLVGCVVGDGNLLFNVGPGPTGEIEPAQVKRMMEIGQWLKKYGESIYKTRGGPFIMSDAGGSTFKGNCIYLHILNWNDDSINLPIKADVVRSCSLLTGGKPIMTATPEGIRISVLGENRDSIDTIVKLDLKYAANLIKPVKVGKAASLATEMPATASNVYTNDYANYGPSKAFDDDFATRWATDAGVKSAYLDVDMGKLVTFDTILIDEAGYDRVRRFELQYRDTGDWQTFYQGTSIGADKSIRVKPVTARYVRLNILEAIEGPTISEFRINKATR